MNEEEIRNFNNCQIESSKLGAMLQDIYSYLKFHREKFDKESPFYKIINDGMTKMRDHFILVIVDEEEEE